MATFKIQARVLDLLGEQQIANGPTAVSELFKNAHDAYADRVRLDIYTEDDRAVLWDDGIGMSEADLLNRWLVVGTSAKMLDRREPPPKNYIARPIQGEKGIGRLAISMLGDSLLLISKRRRLNNTQLANSYAALFINWNIVQNLNLMLADVEVPVLSFSDLSELSSSIVADMIDAFRASLLRTPASIWADKSEAQLRQKILRQLDEFDYSPVFAQRTDLEKKPGGTLFYIRHLRPELRDYVRAPTENEEDDQPINMELIQLLSNFRNRFGADGFSISGAPQYPFDVDVRHWDKGAGTFVSTFQNWHTFEPEDLRAYDHKIDVRFDEFGRSEGTLEVFGNTIVLPHVDRQPRRRLDCGPFELRLWYYQGEPSESRLDAEQYFLIKKKLGRFGGLMIYRDGLRVLPYGRPEIDWLTFEERRSRNAGRYFFSYRRMFGYVAISAAKNPLLRDKSGREGLIENAGYRQLRRCLVDFFCDIAAQHFFKNDDFEKTVDELKSRAGLVGKQQSKALARRDALKTELDQALRHIERAGPLIESLLAGSLAALKELPNLGERELTAALVDFRERLNRIEAGGRVKIPRNLSLGRDRNAKRLLHDHQEAKSRFEIACQAASATFNTAIKDRFPEAEQAATRHKMLRDALFQAQTRVGKTFSALLSSRDVELQKVHQALVELRDEQLSRVEEVLIRETAEDTVEDALLSSAGELPVLLDSLARAAQDGSAVIEEMSNDLAAHIAGFFGEHREAVLAAQTDLIEELRESVNRNLDLVQLGLSVEVIDHELNKLYRGIRADLTRLTTIVANHRPGAEAVERLRANFQHLEQRYKLMSPLYRGTYRTKSDISGAKILEYVREFLNRPLETIGISVTATTAAREFRVREVPSVVLPVFVNLVDNSVYWLRDASEKRIVFDVRDGVITICDTGPGIHETMLQDIFEPFFSTKPNGRGLGLYVARANLERYGHQIWATSDPKYRSLAGACFCIRFNRNNLMSE